MTLDAERLAWYPWVEQIFIWLRSAVLCDWVARWPEDFRLGCSRCRGDHYGPEHVQWAWSSGSRLLDAEGMAAWWAQRWALSWMVERLPLR